MPNGSLAFISACETAMGDEKLPDEAMSLGASFLFSDFRSVIATIIYVVNLLPDVHSYDITQNLLLYRGNEGSSWTYSIMGQ